MAEPAKAEAPVLHARPNTVKINSMVLAEHKRNMWVCECSSEATLEDMLKPEFWVHDARKLKPRDEVEVWALDGSWLEVFIVRSVSIPDIGRAVVRVARKDDIPRSDDKKAEAKAIGGLSVKWRGPNAKWGVVRDSDSEVIKDKLETREDAESYRDKFVKGH